jgi:hypothetical protein
MNARYQLWSVWAGPLFALLFFIALWPFADMIPPPSPTLSGEELVSKFESNINLFRAAIPIGIIAAALSLPWAAVVSVQIAHIERGKPPILTFISLAGGVVNAVAFSLSFVFMAPAAYRLGRNPELVQMFIDFTWLEIVLWYPAFSLQCVVIALAGFMDKSEEPIFPRWVCFFMLWVALLVAPGSLAIFFFTGPFAWNGLFAFWLPAGVFGVYFMTLVPMLIKAIKRQAATQE